MTSGEVDAWNSDAGKRYRVATVCVRPKHVDSRCVKLQWSSACSFARYAAGWLGLTCVISVFLTSVLAALKRF